MENISLFGRIRGISVVSEKKQASLISEIELTDKELETIRGGWDHYGRDDDDDERRRHHHHHHHYGDDWNRW